MIVNQNFFCLPQSIMCHWVYFEEILKLWSMEVQEENVLWRAKAKQNKTVTTKHMKTIKKEQLFDSFAILQSLLLTNSTDEIFTPSQSENNKTKKHPSVELNKSKQAKTPYH